MTSEEYREACRKLGLTPTYSAAAALGISKTTAGRYARGNRDIPEPVARLLQAMIRERKASR